MHLQKHRIPLPDFLKVDSDPWKKKLSIIIGVPMCWGSGGPLGGLLPIYVRLMKQRSRCRASEDAELLVVITVLYILNSKEAELHEIGEKFGYPMMLKSRALATWHHCQTLINIVKLCNYVV